MAEVTTVLVFLCIVTLLAFWSRNWTIPYPTIMVLVGGVIALIPGLPNVHLTPDVVFLIFLPPLLYAAAWQTPFHEFKNNIRPIALLAIGLVLVTTFIVGVVVHELFPGIPWPAAFALGAIISPPDAIAATAVTQKLRVPRRIVVILEGESLLNDASGLVAYRVALAAAAGEVFSWSSAISQFCVSGLGGIVIGIIVGFAVMRIHRRLDEPVIETVVTLLTPFAAYLISEYFHLSGVLAVVCTGIMVREKASKLFSPATRLHANAVWECVVFVLTGLTFIFIGLGLREVVSVISTDKQLGWYSIGAAIVLAVTMLVRLLWVFPAAWIPRLLSKRIARRDPFPPAKYLLVIGWTGMRGVVSLAAALALPHDFPFRNLILFVVFVVILGTLVLQGLSLPWLVRKLQLAGTGRSIAEQEIDARLSLLAAANLYLQDRLAAGGTENEIEYLKTLFRSHADSWLSRLELDEESLLENQTVACHKNYVGALSAQRKRLHELQRDGIVEETLVQKIEREIDMEESRVNSIHG